MAKKTRDNKSKAAPAAGDAAPRLSAHPRARRQIRAVKAWSGLCVFLLVQVLALRAGLPMFDAGLRALVAGTAAYVLGWVVAVIVWRQVAVAELEDLRRRLKAAAEEQRAASA